MGDEHGPVLFYGHNGTNPYRCFSNFYPAPFKYEGHEFANSEQAFMYHKSKDMDYQKKVLATKDPYKVKKLGRQANLRSDWDQIKYDVMIRVCEAKFSQNPALKAVLLGTGDRVIHEDCRDPWWGGGPNYPKGRDLLGKALMVVRQRLRDAEEGA